MPELIDEGGLAIVILGPDDWERLRAIRLDALLDSPTAFSSTLDREKAFAEADWRDRLAAAFWAVADVDGVDVACAGAYLPGGVTVEAELVALWVRPEHRGMGFGGALVETVALWAETMGCEALHAWVTEGNEIGQILYDHHGFVATGERQPLPSHPELDELALTRRLGDLG